MTIDEQRIFVCDKLLGWKPPEPHQIVEGYSFQDWVDDLPLLTLDWLHECWIKLTPEQKKQFFLVLSRILGAEVFYYCNVLDCARFEDSSAEQRLAALVKTLGGKV